MPFRYFDKGSLAVIGRASAVAQIGPLHMSGLLAWLTWLFVHLMYLVEFSNRVLVFVQWGFLYLTFNRGARLITGPESPSGAVRKTRLKKRCRANACSEIVRDGSPAILVLFGGRSIQPRSDEGAIRPRYSLPGIAILCGVFAINVHRAIHQSITADEAMTYDWYIVNPWNSDFSRL